MIDVTIYKKYSFIEHLVPNIAIDALRREVLSNINKVFGISNDNDHLISFSPGSNYNELTELENGKKYLIITNSDTPNLILYSYLETSPITVIVGLSLVGDWDGGGSGTSLQNAHTKNSWTTGDELRIIALSSGTINLSWTSVYANSDESSYGEASIWKNTGPDIGSPAVELQIGSSGSGSYSTHLDQGQYLTLIRRDRAYWTGIRAWLT